MADQKISQLTTISTVDTAADLFPIVDTSATETKKITPSALKTALALNNVDNTSDANKPISSATQTALDGKQDTLVSGTNIKTINSTSLLGSGDIAISASPSGVAGAIQFSNGSAFASDATNFFWDDTNNRLGVGTNAPTSRLQIQGSGATSATTSLLVTNSAGTQYFKVADDGAINLGAALTVGGGGGGTLTGSNGGRMQINSQFDMAIFATNGGIGIGGAAFSPVASAICELRSTAKGFLPPRMTTAQKNAIAAPASGLVVYDTTTNKLCCYNGTSWNDLF